MGRIDRLILYGIFALLLPTGASLAADMPETPYVPAPVPYEFGSGWYLRGDIGYKVYGSPNAHFDVAGYGNMTGENLSDTGLAGVGFGYKWNDWFRTDVTLDYEWPGNFHGRLNCPDPCTGSASAGILGRVRQHLGLDHAGQRLFRPAALRRRTHRPHALCRRRYRCVLPDHQQRPLHQSERRDGHLGRRQQVEPRLVAHRRRVLRHHQEHPPRLQLPLRQSRRRGLGSDIGELRQPAASITTTSTRTRFASASATCSTDLSSWGAIERGGAIRRASCVLQGGGGSQWAVGSRQ